MLTEEKLKQFQETLEKSFTETMEKKLPEVIDASVEKKFNSEIAEKINAALKAAGLDKMNFQGFGKGNDAKEKKEVAVKFFKALMNKDREGLKELGSISTKTMTEGTDSAGGFLVPEEVMNEVDRIAEDFGLIRKLARTLPMGKDTLNMPTLGSKPNVYWPGEGNAGTASQATLKNVQLNAKTLVGLTPMSNELLEDADLDVVQMIVELFAEQLAGEEDNQGLNGVGAPFTGILNHPDVNTATAVAGHNTLAEVDPDDLEDAIGLMPSTILGGCVWTFHRQVWSQIKKIKQGSQSLVAFNTTGIISMKTEGSVALTPVGMLMGYPVYLSEKMPSSPAAGEPYGIFGNYSKFYFGNRKQMAVSIAQEATVGGVNLFEVNASAVRVLERIALAVGVAEAFTVLRLNAA